MSNKTSMEVIAVDDGISFIVVDQWIPFQGYEARTVQAIDMNTGEMLIRRTQLKKNGDFDWFAAP